MEILQVAGVAGGSGLAVVSAQWLLYKYRQEQAEKKSVRQDDRMDALEHRINEEVDKRNLLIDSIVKGNTDILYKVSSIENQSNASREENKEAREENKVMRGITESLSKTVIRLETLVERLVKKYDND